MKANAHFLLVSNKPTLVLTAWNDKHLLPCQLSGHQESRSRKPLALNRLLQGSHRPSLHLRTLTALMDRWPEPITIHGCCRRSWFLAIQSSAQACLLSSKHEADLLQPRRTKGMGKAFVTTGNHVSSFLYIPSVRASQSSALPRAGTLRPCHLNWGTGFKHLKEDSFGWVIHLRSLFHNAWNPHTTTITTLSVDKSLHQENRWKCCHVWQHEQTLRSLWQVK